MNMACRLINLHTQPLRVDLRGGGGLLLAPGEISAALREELLYDNLFVAQWERMGWLQRQPARMSEVQAQPPAARPAPAALAGPPPAPAPAPARQQAAAGPSIGTPFIDAPPTEPRHGNLPPAGEPLDGEPAAAERRSDADKPAGKPGGKPARS
jgi:hypothetical protein